MNRRARCFFLLAVLLWLGGLPAWAHRPQPLETRVGGWEQFASGQTSVVAVQSPENAMGLRGCAYKTASGRLKWLNRDPIGEQGGLNLYGFVANNPINNVDPLGLWTFEAYGGAIFGGYLSFGYDYGHISYRAGLGAAAGYSFSFDPKPKQSDLTPGTWEGGLIGKADIGRGPVGAGIEGEVGGTKDPCDKGKKFASAGVSGSALILSGNAGIGEETEPNGANDPDKWHYSAPPPNWQLNIPTDGNVWKGNWLPKERASSGGFVGPFIGHQF